MRYWYTTASNEDWLRAILVWNDPDIGVEWPLELIGGVENLILADKDKNLQSFAQLMERYDRVLPPECHLQSGQAVYVKQT